jgi:CheY-like chemotaxis protein
MKKTILIIEDDARHMKLTTSILSANGYKVAQAWNGKDGIDTARTSKPDLIITDIMMPAANGLEVARALKNDDATRKIPIIAMTADVMDGAQNKALAAGCDEYLAKPIDIKRLLTLIEKHTGRSL